MPKEHTYPLDAFVPLEKVRRRALRPDYRFRCCSSALRFRKGMIRQTKPSTSRRDSVTSEFPGCRRAASAGAPPSGKAATSLSHQTRLGRAQFLTRLDPLGCDWYPSIGKPPCCRLPGVVASLPIMRAAGKKKHPHDTESIQLQDSNKVKAYQIANYVIK
jgi:hypothetical protein